MRNDRYMLMKFLGKIQTQDRKG